MKTDRDNDPIYDLGYDDAIECPHQWHAEAVYNGERHGRDTIIWQCALCGEVTDECPHDDDDGGYFDDDCGGCDPYYDGGYSNG